MRKTLHFILLIAVVAVIATACDNQSPSGTVTAWFNSLKNKDYDKATEYTLFDTQDEAELKERRIQAASLYRAATEKWDKTLGDISILDEQIAPDGKTATVRFKVEYANGGEDPVILELVNKDGRWYLPDPLQSKGENLAL